MTTKQSAELEQFLGTWLPFAEVKMRDATERHLKIEEMARTGSIELAAAAHLLLVEEVRTVGELSIGAYDSEVARMRALATRCTAEEQGVEMAVHSDVARERNSFLEESFSATTSDRKDQRTGLP
jgi:hypothetical protein